MNHDISPADLIHLAEHTASSLPSVDQDRRQTTWSLRLAERERDEALQRAWDMELAARREREWRMRDTAWGYKMRNIAIIQALMLCLWTAVGLWWWLR